MTGIQERTHRWTCDYKSAVTERRSCDAGDGFYSDWTPWNGCSTICVGGIQLRERTHSCGLRDARGIAYTHWQILNDAVLKAHGHSGQTIRSAVQPVLVVLCDVHANTSASIKSNQMLPLAALKVTT